MTERFQPTVIPTVEVEKVYTDFERVELGQWYWVEGKSTPILMCVVKIGSNYAELREPEMAHAGQRFRRVHRDEFDGQLKFEPNAEAKIRELVSQYQAAIAQNMEEIQSLTVSLGIAPRVSLQPLGNPEGKSLALLSGQVNVDAFKNALILARQETLPALFEKNGKLTNELGRWMGASSMPMKAKLGLMKQSVEQIEDRLFNIQLYSGMLEQIITVAEGQPAAKDEKLRIMQRRLYMDEECLLDYSAGGMDFRSMREFDQWLAKPNNRDRILPFPRCMVSMQIRRNSKDRSGSGLSAFIQIKEEMADKFTYLIIRNGEQIYRVCSETHFGELMFPDRATYDPAEPMMMKMFGGRVEKMMPKREYDSLVESSQDHDAARKKWEAENPGQMYGLISAQRPFGRFNNSDWHPFDDSSVYFDEGRKLIQNDIKEYNRIALVVQGLFDRTTTLLPHPPVQMWRPDSFSSSVELIYDSSSVLHHGKAPDIQAYINACNAQTTHLSVMHGQELVWMEREAERERRRSENDWRVQSNHKFNAKLLRPHGDPGPGLLSRMSTWKPRSKTATFTWKRERRQYNEYEPFVTAKITVPLDRLFNVSAYKLGDFKQFFADPRTRGRYLEWAPMLLSAENYHLGRLEAKEPL